MNLEEHVARTPRWWQTYVTDVVADAESAAEEHRKSVPAGRSLVNVAVVLITSALSLAAIRFLRSSSLGTGYTTEFDRLMRWAGISIVGYFALPLVAIRLTGQRLRSFGFRRPVPGTGRPYLVLFLASVPILFAASFLPAFQEGYPFYEPGPGESWWPRLIVWWAAYILQFVAVEFFFRGYMLFGLSPRLGIASVFVMVVPYTMIHFDKPMAEALSAILGGSVLGFLALKSNSFWWAAAIHIGIAMTMESLTLWHAGFF